MINRSNEQGSIFPQSASEELSRVFLSLFYFNKYNLDFRSISLLLKHYGDDIVSIYNKPNTEIKQLFADHLHIKGYVAVDYLFDRNHVSLALKYADSQLRTLRSTFSGDITLRTQTAFPTALKQSAFDINWLFVHPSTSQFDSKPLVAIIGSRESTSDQMQNARNAAGEVAGMGGYVITGLATGADTAAYEGAILQQGKVIGVLGTGIQRMYPKENIKALSHIIERNGSILSELPPQAPGNKTSFILRNRIIAALADVVVVVSGKYYSGTSHTIRFGKQMGKTLISIDQSKHSGISKLIAELGGKVITPDELPAHIEQAS